MSNWKEYMPVPKTSGKPPFTVEVPGSKDIEGETKPRRNPASRDGLVTVPHPDVTTIFDILKYSAERFGNAKAVGTRRLIKTHHENKKVKKTVDGQTKEVDKQWTYYELSEYSYLSFVEYEKRVVQIGSGLRKLGLQKGDGVHMYAATSANWLAMSHGAMSQSMPMATAYDTLGQEGLKVSLVQTRSKLIYCDPHLLPTLIKPLKDAKDIRFVVYDDTSDADKGNVQNLMNEHSHLTILGLEEVREMGEANPVETVPPQPDDLCCIMYTSGSTGAPKGVSLKHKAVVASVAGADVVVGKYIGPGDGLLTYLPQAHILEFVFECACLFWGGTMGYGSPKTLSDTSVRNCKGDIREFRPTILVGVPAVWESVKKGIIGKVNSGSPIVKNLFWSALAAKSFLMASGLPGSGVLDAVVFKKIKDATGGRLRICLNGGGPIAKDTLRFISMAITPMISGYGLTETTAMGALMDPMHWTDNAIGDLEASVEIKLVDFADAGYYATNKPPQGEIWIRGPSVIDSYYDNEKETAEAFSKDGWFKTGDIGEWDQNGQLRIIDRKKNLVKTLNGEYIALEKLESIYRSATVVANICVYAAQDQGKPVAIIVPAEPALKKVADTNGIEGNSVEELVHSEKLNSIVLKDLQNAGRQGGLQGIEIIDGVVLAEEEWTAANGLVTAAQKINRRSILQKYQKQINKAYGGR